MTEFKVGDRVKVTAAAGSCVDRSGTVAEVHHMLSGAPSVYYRVRLDPEAAPGPPALASFWPDELEPAPGGNSS